MISHSHKQRKWDMALPGNCLPWVSLPHPLKFLNVAVNHKASPGPCGVGNAWVWYPPAVLLLNSQLTLQGHIQTHKWSHWFLQHYLRWCQIIHLSGGFLAVRLKKNTQEHLFTPEARKGLDLNLQPTLGFTSVHMCRHHCCPEWFRASVWEWAGKISQSLSSFMALLTSIMLKCKGHKSCR